VKSRPGRARYESAFYRNYRGFLIRALRRPLLSLGAVVVVFVVSLAGFRFVPNIFFPPNDRPTFTAEIYLPTGTPVTRTETVVAEIEDFIEDSLTAGPDRPEGVTNWGTFIGEGGPRFYLSYRPEQSRSDFAFMLLNATSRPVIDELVPKLEDFCRRNYPDVKALVRPMALGPPAWPPVEIRISGRDTDKLFQIVEAVKTRLRETPGTKLIDDDWGARSKKLFVRIDQPRARRAGVTSQAVAVSLQAFLSGLQATGFREDDQVIPVTLRSVAGERQDIDKLETLNVYAQATGESVPLKQVADVEVVFQPAVIQRYDRLRTVTVESGLEPSVTASEVNASLVPWLEKRAADWGLGYGWALGGEAETSSRAQDSIKDKLPVAGLVILLLLVAQFNSIRRPLIILMTIPLSIIGVVIGLLVARSYFGFMTLLGLVSLAGIVINNAIVLLDRIRIEIEDNGLSPARAVVESAQKRLRPILLTTGTTVGGLLPLWLGGGPIFRPMAIAIVFGLIFATVLTLGVVPILYSILYRTDFRGFTYDRSTAQS
jgi:multidrug efflux pump subunit AcrB